MNSFCINPVSQVCNLCKAKTTLIGFALADRLLRVVAGHCIPFQCGAADDDIIQVGADSLQMNQNCLCTIEKLLVPPTLQRVDDSPNRDA